MQEGENTIEKRMGGYEMGYFLKMTEEKDAANDFLDRALERVGAIIVEATPPSPRRLAYPIQKEKQGLWGAIKFRLDTEKLQELKELIKNEDALLRYLILREVPLAKKPGKPKRTLRLKKEAAPKIHREAEKEKPKVKLEELEKKLEEILEG